jgi:hypothetical protein
MTRRCRLARTDFCALVLLLVCGLGVAQAADQAASAVTPPKPVVIQPTAMMAPPPPVPDAADTTAKPSVKTAKSRQVAMSAKAKPKKPAAKSKPKGRQR